MEKEGVYEQIEDKLFNFVLQHGDISIKAARQYLAGFRLPSKDHSNSYKKIDKEHANSVIETLIKHNLLIRQCGRLAIKLTPATMQKMGFDPFELGLYTNPIQKKEKRIEVNVNL